MTEDDSTTTAPEIVDLAGVFAAFRGAHDSDKGQTGLARAVNEFRASLGYAGELPIGTVGAWAFRGSIPVGYWIEIVEAAKMRGIQGITTDLLARLAAQKGG